MLAMALETGSTLGRSLVLISLNFQGEIALITHATTERVLSRPVALEKAFFCKYIQHGSRNHLTRDGLDPIQLSAN